MKTISANPSTVEHNWWVIDLEGKTVGRAASQIASILRGKNKPDYTPHVDNGDFVVVINAEKVVFTGRKLQNKVYYTHKFSGSPGSLKSITAEKQLQRHPDRVITAAVQGMLPRGPLGRKMLRKFKVYAGAEHPHAAQQPKPFEV